MLNNENSYLFKFAWKSIRRNAGRSFFIGFSVSLSVVIAVWVVAFFDGMNHQIEQAVVNTNTGFFQLQDPLYAKSTDSSKPLVWTEELQKKLSSLPITSVSPELVLDGNISTPEGAAGLLVLGIEPDLHKKFLPLAYEIKQGRFLLPNDQDSVVIGLELARIFKFNVGDQLVLNYQDVGGELRSEILNIAGIYHFNSNGFEKRYVYINQSTWQKLFMNQEISGIHFNRVAMMAKDLKGEEIIRNSLSNEGVVVKSWKQLNPEMSVVLEFHDGMIRFFFLIIGITILMTIMTPVRMLWQERYKELKMMAIVGVASPKFWKIGIFEVFLMIALSTVFSILFLIAVIGTQSYTGIDFSFLSADGVSIERAGIKLPQIIYPQLTIQQLIITFVFVIFVLSVSYIWSIHKTLQKLDAEL